MPVTGIKRIFMPILMKTWLKSRTTTPHRQQFAEAVTRLFGNFDSAEQNHGVKREYDHAANESILLGNDRENEIVVGGAPAADNRGPFAFLPANPCPSTLLCRR